MQAVTWFIHGILTHGVNGAFTTILEVDLSFDALDSVGSLPFHSLKYSFKKEGVMIADSWTERKYHKMRILPTLFVLVPSIWEYWMNARIQS